MKKFIVFAAAAALLFSVLAAAVHATPDRAAVTGKTCGECHSGGRHMGNR